MKTSSLWMIAAACFIAPASVAHARSAYDGSWDLAFVTRDPSYNFTVNMALRADPRMLFERRLPAPA